MTFVQDNRYKVSGRNTRHRLGSVLVVRVMSVNGFRSLLLFTARDASSRNEIKADNSPSNVIEVYVPDFVGAHRCELLQLPTHGVIKAAFDTGKQMDLSESPKHDLERAGVGNSRRPGTLSRVRRHRSSALSGIM